MKKLIGDNDLGIPYTNKVNRMIVHVTKSILGLNKLNALYEKVSHLSGVDCAAKVLSELRVTVDVSSDSLDNIPETGPFILISNHPHGALDGLIMIDRIARLRPDVKFLGNFLLSQIEPLHDFFLEVNPFNQAASRNITGIRKAWEHIAAGNGLIIFPAGEVSTYQSGFSKLEDKEWELSMMKFIRKAQIPVIPAFIGGQNSFQFHLYGKIHPMFRTARLPLELINKHDRNVKIEIGAPISVHLQDSIDGESVYNDYMRASVYYLSARFINNKPVKSKPKKSVFQTVVLPVVDEISDERVGVISREIEQLKSEYRILDITNFVLYCAPASDIPEVLIEIGRLREITFREVGEGTNRAIDVDNFDEYYQHLFIWDSVSRVIVGAYRIGFGDEILKNRGFEGFYVHSLFEFSSKFSEILRSTIELGRSFIRKEYQRQAKPLMLLWRGILSILLKHPSYQYLIGPVSISENYSLASRLLTINYIKEHYWNAQLAKQLIPRSGLKKLSNVHIDTHLLKNIHDISLVEKIISDLDSSHDKLPVLLKRYLQLNGTVIGLNIDASFNNSLDALLLLDITKVPSESIKLLTRIDKS